MAGPDRSATRHMLVRFGATGTAQRRLFCLPFAGGGPATYRVWPKSLPSDVEVVAVVLPGRDPRSNARGDIPPDAIADVVGPLLDAICELQANEPLPFAVFGHSMGALVAFELAVAMEHAAERTSHAPVPSHLLVAGRRAPDALHTGESIYELADDPFLDAMQRLYGGVPDVVRNEPEVMALFLPGLRADVHIFETYAPMTSRRVGCPVRVYGGADDRRPTPDALGGWQRVAQRDISVRVFPGDHFYLNDAREQLVADIARYWTAAPASPTPASSELR
ncbi:MAG: thioesterase II family protein [Ilumatobacteraceae bacterium]